MSWEWLVLIYRHYWMNSNILLKIQPTLIDTHVRDKSKMTSYSKRNSLKREVFAWKKTSWINSWTSVFGMIHMHDLLFSALKWARYGSFCELYNSIQYDRPSFHENNTECGHFVMVDGLLNFCRRCWLCYLNQIIGSRWRHVSQCGYARLLPWAAFLTLDLASSSIVCFIFFFADKTRCISVK